MSEMNPAQLEANREGFDLAHFLRCRDKTWEGMKRIREIIVPGMREEDATKKAEAILREMGAEKFWHRTYVRFGANTKKMYGQPSEPNMVLKETDIFFLDIGPVWDGKYEGDSGATYTLGSDSLQMKCAKDVVTVFEKTRDHWRKTGATGQALYDYSSQAAKELGWELLIDVNGHRLGDFPHQAFYKGGLSEVDFKPAPYAWVLETHIQHSTLPVAAFYEDILY